MAGSKCRTMSAWRNYIRAKAEITRAVFHEVREHGLSGGQLGILRVLAEAGDEGIQLNEISHQLYMTCGNVTGLIDRLEDAGHLRRQPHPDDRRVTLAVMTPAGRDLFDEVYPPHIARIERLMSALTNEEQAQLADFLGRLGDRAIEMSRSPQRGSDPAPGG